MKYNKLFSLFVLLLLAFQMVNCKKNSTDPEDEISYTDLTGEYFGQEPPGTEPVLFAPDILKATSSWWWHSPPVFSPDGDELFFCRYFNENPSHVKMFYMRCINDKWTTPEQVPFTDTNYDNNPFFSVDGNSLYIISTRSDGIFFVVHKTENGWTEPHPINIPVLPSMSAGQHFSLSAGKSLCIEIFNGSDDDIYLFNYDNLNYTTSERLSFNSDYTDVTPCIDPNEEYIIFSSHRPGGYGQGDLYISFKRADNTWSEAVNMSEKINSGGSDLWPCISPDGNYLFFVTNGKGEEGFNPYWVDISIIDELR